MVRPIQDDRTALLLTLTLVVATIVAQTGHAVQAMWAIITQDTSIFSTKFTSVNSPG